MLPDSLLVELHETQAVDAPARPEETSDSTSSLVDTDVGSALDSSYLSPVPTIRSGEPPAAPARRPVVLFPAYDEPHEPSAVGVDELGRGAPDVDNDQSSDPDSQEEDSEIIAILHTDESANLFQLPAAMTPSVAEGGSLLHQRALQAQADLAVWSRLSPLPTARSQMPPPAPRKPPLRVMNACPPPSRGQSLLSPLPTARSQMPPPAPRKPPLRVMNACPPPSRGQSLLSPPPTARSQEPPPAPRKPPLRVTNAYSPSLQRSLLSPPPTARSQEPPPAPRKPLLYAVDARRPMRGNLAVKRGHGSEESSTRALRARQV
jgi:hypothetical protein